MKLRAEQLSQNLTKSCSPIYIISGDEALLVQECCDTIRTYCQDNGFADREIMHVESGFDWQDLLVSANSMSLFAEKKLIELRLPTGKPGDAGGKALIEYAENASPDNLLLIICNKLDSSTQRTKWFKTVEAKGVSIQVWPIDSKQLPQWIGSRLKQAGLKADPAAIQLLTERVEGNLLAAVQEIEKLKLYSDDGTINADIVAEAVANNARYDIFNMVDRAISGDATTSLKMLRGLRSEGTEAPIVLWALSREIRSLCHCAIQLEQGNGIERILQNQRVWDKRKPLFKTALKRLRAKHLQQMLRLSVRIDHSIKGVDPANTWDTLEKLTLALAGKPIPLAP